MADFFKHVLLVLTVPAEFDNYAISVMRDCAFNAGLIKERCSKNLKFTTERKNLHYYNLYLFSCRSLI